MQTNPFFLVTTTVVMDQAIQTMVTADKCEGTSGELGPAPTAEYGNGDSGDLVAVPLDTSRNRRAWKGASGSSLCKDQVGSLGASKRASGARLSTRVRHGRFRGGAPERGSLLLVRAAARLGAARPYGNGWAPARLQVRRAGRAWGVAAAGALLALGCVGPSPADEPQETSHAGDGATRPLSPLSVEKEALSTPSDTTGAPTNAPEWTTLFDGESLGRWRAGVFGDSDELDFEEGGAVLPIGVPLTGITYLDEAPQGAYSLEVQATKKYGNDFFLGVTFPVRDGHVTLVLGGWGGSLCGLSCIDGEDASTNATQSFRSFPNGKRQTVVIEVTDERVRASVNGDELVDVSLDGHSFSVRPEVSPSVPLGISSFATCTLLHSVRLQEQGPRGSTSR